MKILKRIAVLSAMLTLAITLFTQTNPLSANAANRGPVSYYGQLEVSGTKIIGENTGRPAQVKGMSFFWSNWSGPFYNTETVERMVNEFKCDILRCAYGVDDNGSPYDTSTKAGVKEVVEAAIAQDIYVIIDWHSHGAHNNADAAKEFFTEMAKEYGSYDNVIFEVYNEPTYSSWADVKAYAEKVIPVIRQYSDNLILVGTPTWSQDVDLAAENPISATNATNVAYVLHFYAGTHTQYLRDKAETAMNKNLPIFVSEWGSVNADGNGAIAYDSTEEWLEWMDEKQLSWCNWAINDKDETSSTFYSDGTLRPAGTYLKSILNESATTAEWRTAGSGVTPGSSPNPVATPTPTPVPTATPTPEVTDYETIYTGSFASGDWKNNLVIEASKFNNLQFNGTEKIIITYTTESGKNWANFKAAVSNPYDAKIEEELSLSNVSVKKEIILTNEWSSIETGGLMIQGSNWIITKVELDANRETATPTPAPTATPTPAPTATPAPVVLATPQFTVANVAGGVQIKWDFVDDAIGYIVYRREAGGVFQKIAGYVDGVTKSYVDKNVVNGTAYFYAVKAINSTTQSKYTTKGINYKAMLTTPQFTVANVTGGVQIKWDFVDDATGYIVYRREAGGVFQKIAGYTDGVTKSYVDKNVVNGTAYFYAVKAINGTIQSTYTTKGINYKAGLATPQFTVANTADGVQIKWDFVDGATGYIVYRREAGGVFQKIAGYTDGVTKSYVDKTAVSGTTYYYAVKAISSTKQSTYNSVEITP